MSAILLVGGGRSRRISAHPDHIDGVLAAQNRGDALAIADDRAAAEAVERPHDYQV
jgi:hypothetical protein